jgi:probable O-glycosylation ligase (exosortase A-associated)
MKGLVFTYLLTYGGAIVSIRRPFIGLLVYVCFAIIKPEAMWPWAVPEGNYSLIIAVALLIGWVLGNFGNWRLGRARGIVYILITYWAWMAFCALLAPNSQVAWYYVEQQSKVFLPFLVGITTLDSIDKLKQLLWVIVLSQGYVAFELNLAYLNGFNQVREIGFAGMDNNSVSIAMVTGVGMAFFLGFETPRWWQKALTWAATLLMGHSVLLAFSRGGMLGLIVTALVAFLIIPKQPKHYAVFLIAILLGLRLAGKEVRERFGTLSGGEGGTYDYSSQSRLDLWTACWRSMCQQPLGLGPAHWPLVAEQFGFTRGKEAHSLWFQLGAELGFPGLVCLILFYGLCIVRLWPLMRQDPSVDPWLRAVARMVIASLIGFMFSAQFVSLSGLELPYYTALVGAGALRLAGQPEETVALSFRGLPTRKPISRPLARESF